jgi:hypothetical protein
VPLSFATAQTSASRTASQKEIVANEKAILEAIVKGDMKTFHSYVPPDTFGLDEAGLMKTADLDQMLAQCKFTSAAQSGSQFYWINNTTAVHIYKWRGKGACQGEAVPEERWCSTVWTNTTGKWLAAFHQESTVTAPPAAPKKK